MGTRSRNELVKQDAFGDPCHGEEQETEECQPFRCSPEHVIEADKDVKYLGITWSSWPPNGTVVGKAVVEKAEGWASANFSKHDEVIEVNGKPVLEMSPMMFEAELDVRPLTL